MKGQTKKQKILIVDDQSENIDILIEILKADYKMVATLNGEKALKMAASKIPPDLILLDIMMPVMDGYEVCRRLKNDEALRNIPVIFITAKSESYNEKKGLELGAIDYITKPIRRQIVKARVKNHMKLILAREKIKRQNKELLEAAKLRDDVERITRHDLKTPLNSVIALPGLLKQADYIPEEHIKFLRIIEESGLKMLNMINLSLDLFKMERRIYQFKPQPVNIIKTIDRIVEEITGNKEIDILIEINDKPDHNNTFLVQGEELLCYSMLSNLVKNAIEASPENSQILIKIGHEENMSSICINNKGTVPQEIRDRFFDKFVTSGKKSGTGLGTYSARLIAETQGGTIELDTSSENYTSVIVKLQREYDKTGKIALSSKKHAEIPTVLLSQFEQSLIKADMMEIEAFIEKIRPYDSETANVLKPLADDFDYSRILDFLKKM